MEHDGKLDEIIENQKKLIQNLSGANYRLDRIMLILGENPFEPKQPRVSALSITALIKQKERIKRLKELDEMRAELFIEIDRNRTSPDTDGIYSLSDDRRYQIPHE